MRQSIKLPPACMGTLKAKHASRKLCKLQMASHTRHRVFLTLNNPAPSSDTYPETVVTDTYGSDKLTQI